MTASRTQSHTRAETTTRRSRAVLLDLGLAANVALAAFALPIYLHLYASPGVEALLRTVVLVHIAPTLALFIVARLLSVRPRAHRAYWSAAIFVATLSILRAIEMVVSSRYLESFDPLDLAASVPAPHILDVTMYACAILVLFACGVLLVRRYDALTSTLASLAPIWALATVALVVPLMLAPAPRAQAATGPAPSGPVYILVLDALGRDVLLREGAVDAALYPNLSALASEGLLFTNATSNWGYTCHALPTMIGAVSLGPCGDGFLADTSQPTLFSALAERYRVVIYEEWLRTCPSGAPYECRDRAYVTATRPGRILLAHWLPRTIRLRLLSGLGADAVGGSFLPYTMDLYGEVLADLDHPEAASTASFIHILLPHYPFVFDREGEVRADPPRHFMGLPEEEPAVYANYVRQAQFVDTLVGRFVDALRERGLYEKATILVTGDHGPGPALDWRGPFSQEHPYVTLILRGPGVPRGTTDMDYQHVDLTPTLTDLLGLGPVPHSIGISVFAAERPQREKRFGWRGEYFRQDPASGRWARE